MKQEARHATRRRFSKEFKLEAVKLVKELAQDEQDAFPGGGNMKPEQAEITRLSKEVAKLKMERDLLKKAAVSSTSHCNNVLNILAGV